jgi:hypothetical protein
VTIERIVKIFLNILRLSSKIPYKVSKFSFTFNTKVLKSNNSFLQVHIYISGFFSYSHIANNLMLRDMSQYGKDMKIQVLKHGVATIVMRWRKEV